MYSLFNLFKRGRARLMEYEMVTGGADALNRMMGSSPPPAPHFFTLLSRPSVVPLRHTLTSPLYFKSPSSPRPAYSSCVASLAGESCALSGRGGASLVWHQAAKHTHAHAYTHTHTKINVTEGSPTALGNSSASFLSPFAPLSTLLKRPRGKALWEFVPVWGMWGRGWGYEGRMR